MLTLHLLFFGALAAGSTVLAWFSHVSAGRASPVRQLTLSSASWLLSAAILFAGMSVFTPKEPATYLPTLAVALFLPMLVASIALFLVNKRWSRSAKLLFAFSLSAVLALGASPSILIATCAVQSNCL